MSELLFRNQFVFTNKEIHGPEHFVKSVLPDKDASWQLYHHPDLPVHTRQNDTCVLLLLGYILDPMHPQLNDQAILDNLAGLRSFESMLTAIHGMNGRYIILYKDQTGIRAVNDAVGFREFYYLKQDDHIACGSTVNILAEVFNLSITQDPAKVAFFNSKEYKDSDYVWLGYRTLYEDILHLPPNHYLDLNSVNIKRFWPKARIPRIPLKTVAEECAALLKGTMEAALNRYTLHMGITSGWDTRLLLSATKQFKDRVFFYINKPHWFTENNRDLRIARKLSKTLDLNLHEIEISCEVDKEFREIFYKNNILAREKLLPVYYEVYRRAWQNTHTVSGAMGNGLARIYMHYPEGVPLNGKNMAVFAGYQNLAYPVAELDEWIKEVDPICREMNISIMDLYQWEQENAHWATRTATEQDIVRDEITPFNNRKLIELFWSLEPRYRYQYNPAIYKSIIRILWKEALGFPFNPGLRSFLHSIPRLFGFEQPLYYEYKRRKFLKAIQTIHLLVFKFMVINITDYFCSCDVII